MSCISFTQRDPRTNLHSVNSVPRSYYHFAIPLLFKLLTGFSSAIKKVSPTAVEWEQMGFFLRYVLSGEVGRNSGLYSYTSVHFYIPNNIFFLICCKPVLTKRFSRHYEKQLTHLFGAPTSQTTAKHYQTS